MSLSARKDYTQGQVLKSRTAYKPPRYRRDQHIESANYTINLLMCGLTPIRNGFMSVGHIVFNSLSKWSTGRMFILIPILSLGSWHKNDMVRMIKMQEFAYLCITLRQITPPLEHLIKLPRHISTILTPFTSLWHKNSIHSTHPLC